MTKIIRLPMTEAKRYQDEFGVPLLLAQVLAADGITDEHVIELIDKREYIRCDHDRFIEAKRIIEKAIENETKILICGDYDADGLCATSILVRSLRRLNADVGFYIPDRFNEGYGLGKETVSKALDKGYALFITVDNGVSAFEALDLIHAAKKQVIVVDHHEIVSEVPCDLLIHPSLLEKEYADMCGSGLALQLAEHLIGSDPYNTVLAGIATVGDMVGLWGANRKIVIEALRNLNENRFATLEALNEKPIERYDEETIAFQIVPKLNVAGRLADMANANRVVDYLCSDSSMEIARQSRQILDLNKQRKELSGEMYETARKLRTSGNVVVLTHHSFHEGIVGITAGRLAKEIGRPVFVFAQKGDNLKGSARSVPDVDLRSLTENALGLCIRYGGHAMAAGLEIKGEDLDEFKARLELKADEIDWSSAQETMAVMHLEPQAYQTEDFKELLTYAPFGNGFAMPLMHFENCQVLNYREFSPTFRKWQLKWGNIAFDAIYFGAMADIAKPLSAGRIDLIGKVKSERFRNIEKLSILIEVVQASL
jgi:single-stranded-DNA-specific exonuclease